jgi:hypothetical protein
MAADDVSQRGGVTARHVRDDYEGHPGIGRHPAEETFQGLDSAGGSADAYNGK